ncbi:hypothetical protein ACHAQH_001888 [Verticillium albo-atrum]
MPGKTYFEQQREALIGEIAMVGNEFSSVEALWSQFENVMAKEPAEDTSSSNNNKPAGGSPCREDEQKSDEDEHQQRS